MNFATLFDGAPRRYRNSRDRSVADTKISTQLLNGKRQRTLYTVSYNVFKREDACMCDNVCTRIFEKVQSEGEKQIVIHTPL